MLVHEVEERGGRSVGLPPSVLTRALRDSSENLRGAFPVTAAVQLKAPGELGQEVLGNALSQRDDVGVFRELIFVIDERVGFILGRDCRVGVRGGFGHRLDAGIVREYTHGLDRSLDGDPVDLAALRPDAFAADADEFLGD